MGTEIDCDDVLRLLEKVKSACVTKDPNGQQLLEVCG